MDLLVVVKGRNAWFRVWTELGVPVVGGWSTFRGVEGKVFATLNLRCGPHWWIPQTGCGLVYSGGPTLEPQAMVGFEQETISRMVQGPGFCPHLAPLLGAAPAEVVARWELELLCD